MHMPVQMPLSLPTFALTHAYTHTHTHTNIQAHTNIYAHTHMLTHTRTHILDHKGSGLDRLVDFGGGDHRGGEGVLHVVFVPEGGMGVEWGMG